METTADPKPGLILRILNFPIVRLALLYYVLLYGYISGYQFLIARTGNPWTSLGAGLVVAAHLLFLYLSFVHFVERRPVHELALPRKGREFWLGILIGGGLFTLCVLIAMVFGLFRIQEVNPVSVLLPTLWAAPLAPVFEELVFRGALFRIVEEIFGGWVALIVSSLVFGLVHLSNEGESFLGIASIVLVFGPLLAAPFMLTRRLWLGIGIHFSWNFAMGKIFSGSVSGNEAPTGLFKTNFTGPEWLTGGNAGMEGSPIAILVSAVASVVILVMAVRRGKIVPPVWKRPKDRPVADA